MGLPLFATNIPIPLYSHPMHRGTYLVGVAGGSGSGKTTLVRALRNLLPPDSVTIVSQDDYYRPIAHQLKDANGKVNFDLPGALDLDLLADDLRCLALGEAVYRKEYTFNVEGEEERWMEVRPARVILVEGLFLLHHPGIREQLDLKVFVDASESVQLQRRLGRDQRERGYSVEDILYQWDNHVMPAYRDHLLPYRSLCDLHVVNELQYQKALGVLRDHLAQRTGVPELAILPV